MTNVAMDTLNRSGNPGFAAGAVQTLLLKVQSRYRRWGLYRTTEAELRQYSAAELAELGIASADISRIAIDSVDIPA